MKRLMAVAVLVMLAGCSLSAPVTDPAVLERCGSAPQQHQVDWAIKGYIQGLGFLDPGSVQTRNVQTTGVRQWNSIHGSRVGWEVTFEVNAKNAMGGYTGFKPTGVLISPDGSWIARSFLPQ